MLPNPQVYFRVCNGMVAYFVNGDSLGAPTKKEC